jgi:Zn-dependent protease with chaperone function
VIGVGFLFSWLLWIVVIFELREELLEHYNRREPMHLRLNWFLTLLFSFVYFQLALNRISREREATRESFADEPEGSVTA